ncbi:hypothetical protein M901_2596 [Bacteriovorax sp. DB6_IX]|nr:hypothetical protein M901_2596 [Bacteriovorax sp. DB6_IX]
MFQNSTENLVECWHIHWRKSWCSTKRVDMLQAHIDIFICFYNLDYLGGLSPT